MSIGQSNGLIHVITGNGKGKTTSALGEAMFAAAEGMQVLIVQFLKGRPGVGEIKALDAVDLPITLKQFGRGQFIQGRACEPLDIYIAYQGLKYFSDAMESRLFDMIVLDEINVALDLDLLNIEDVLEVIERKPPGLHLILTGRNAPNRFIELADQVIEMKEIKHPHHQGARAQKGVEF
jgi:cob(I)alamin adenosyltransferase